MVIKRPIIPTIDKGPISRLYPNFYGGQRGCEEQKVARIKEQRKRKGKGQEKNSERIIVQILAYEHSPNENIVDFCTQSSVKSTFLVKKKNRFSSKFKAHLASW